MEDLHSFWNHSFGISVHKVGGGRKHWAHLSGIHQGGFTAEDSPVWTAVSALAVIRVEGSGAPACGPGGGMWVERVCVCVSCVRQGIPGIGND